MTPTPFRAIAVFDIDGVLRDVSGSYRRALADTVEQFTQGQYRPTPADIDRLKAEGKWNNDWEGSQELVYRYFEGQGQARSQQTLNFDELVAFFQSRYRGPDPLNWTGYICHEPLLVDHGYFQHLSELGIGWAFFSGATRGSAQYVLERRLGLEEPPLVAMEDAPGKPDPTGLFQVVQMVEELLDLTPGLPVIYAGDTVADMQTIVNARKDAQGDAPSLESDRPWYAVGILPPHVQTADYTEDYRHQLVAQGADVVFDRVTDLTAHAIQALIER